MSERKDEAVRLLRSSLEGPGPARRISAARQAEIVRAVCDEVDRMPRALPAKQGRWIGKVVAAIALGSALSAAAAVGWMRVRPRPTAPAASAVMPVMPAAPAVATTATTAAAAKPPTFAEPKPAAARGKPAAIASLRPSSASRVGGPARAAVLGDLLERANHLRALRRWREAADLYAAVVADGQPRAASVAAVARATLLLGPLHDPHEALRLFRRALALAPNGPVSDEALYGIAASFRALGDEIEERAALERLLAEGRVSPLRGRAESRLAELAPR